MGWSGKHGNHIYIITSLTLSLDPNRRPPPPLNSPTKPPSASPKQPAPPMFNPSDVLNRAALKKTKMSTNRVPPAEALPPPPPPPPQPTEPDWAPKEYIEKGEHYLECYTLIIIIL